MKTRFRFSSPRRRKFAASLRTDFGQVAAVWGGFYGILMQARFTPGIIRGRVDPEEACWKFYARVGVAILISVPWILLGLLMVSFHAQNPYV